MKYIFNYTDNNACASRGLDEDSFFEEELEFKNDKEALLKVLEIQEQIYDDDENEENYSEYSLEKLIDTANDVDVGFGSPVVFDVKNSKGEKIYDSGLDINEWKGDDYIEDEDLDEYGCDEYGCDANGYHRYDGKSLDKRLAALEKLLSNK